MILRKVRNYLIGPVTIMLYVLVFMLGTPWGSRLTILLLNNFSSVELDYHRGIILKDIEFSQISLSLKNIEVRAEKIKLMFHLRCLWKNQLCIDEIKAHSLTVLMQDNNLSSNATPTEILEPSKALTIADNSLLEMPITIFVKKMSLEKFNFKNNELAIYIKEMNTKFDIKQTNFKIMSSHIKSINVVIAATKDTHKSNVPILPLGPLAILPTAYLPVNLNVTDLTVEKFALNLINKTPNNESNNVAEHIFVDTKVRFDWFKTDIKLNQFQSHYQGVGALALSGKIKAIPPYPLDIELESKINTFLAWRELEGAEQKLAINGDLTNLKLQLKSKGNLAMSAKGSVNLIESNLPFDIVVDASQIPFPANMTQHIQPSTLKIEASGDLQQQKFNFEGLVNGFGYDHAAINFTATHKNKKIDIAFFRFNDLITASDLSLMGTVHYGDKLEWDVNVKSSGFTLPQITEQLAGRLTGNVQSIGQWKNNQWIIALNNTNIDGVLNAKKVSLLGDVKLDQNWYLQPSKLEVNIDDTQINLEGYSDEKWHVNGIIDSPDINKWVMDSRGALQAKFTLTGYLLDPLINVESTLTDFYWKKLSGSEMVINGLYKPRQQHTLDIKLASNKIRWNERDFLNIDTHLDATLAHQRLALQWEGDSSADIILEGDFNEKAQSWQGKLASSNISYKQVMYQPNKPVALAFDLVSDQLTLNQHCWFGTGLELCLKEDVVLGSTGELFLSLKLDTSLIDELFLPDNLVLDTKLLGEARVKWSNVFPPLINAKLSVSSGQVNVIQDAQNDIITKWNSGQLELELTSDFLKTQLLLISDTNEPLINMDAQLALNNSYSLTGHFGIKGFNLQPIETFFSEIALLRGDLNANITLGGTLKSPLVTGPVNIENASIKTLYSPTILENITVQLNLNGNNADVKGNFRLGENQAKLSGMADWQNEFSLNMDLDAEKLTFLLPPQLQTTLSSHLNAKLSNRLLKLSGDIVILEGDLRVKTIPQGSVSLSKDVVFVDDNGNKIFETTRFDVESDIHISMGDKFKVSGQGFDGYIGGELHISQQYQQPLQLFGTLKVLSGRYNAYGQKLVIEKGVVSFNGPIENPHIILRAVRKIPKQDVTVGVSLLGFANAPELTLFSLPSMTQAESLSYLVRGRGLDAETQSRATIGTALGTSLANASGVLKQLEKLPLINKLELDTTDEQATIAGYLGDRVYVKYGIGLQEPINELTVRFYFLSRLWLETVSGLENSAGVFYSFDIK